MALHMISSPSMSLNVFIIRLMYDSLNEMVNDSMNDLMIDPINNLMND